MSLGNLAPRAIERNHYAKVSCQAHSVALALVLATSAVATIDLYLFAASAIH